jgi:hypothetical protein
MRQRKLQELQMGVPKEEALFITQAFQLAQSAEKSLLINFISKHLF